MDLHRAVLLEMLRRHEEKRVAIDDVYVWWGKVRSPNRQQPLGHLDDVLAIESDIGEDDDSDETHLYLTDYRSLYVGQIAAISRDDVRTGDAEHVPAYYTDDGLACDCWFQLWDIRRLVHDDTLAVVTELKRLRNTRYHDRPVSIYGGMVELPLVVTRDDDARFFDAGERERLLGGRYWVEFDAGNAGLGPLERDLRDNLFGTAAWESLDASTRTFIATGERVFRDNRENAAFDFGSVLGSFAKALEKEIGLRLRAVLRGIPVEMRRANLGGETMDLAARRSLTLGEFAHALRHEPKLAEAVRGAANGVWFAGQLPLIIDDFRQVRNDVIHETAADRETALRWRDRLLGVGQQGIFVELAKVRRRGA
jgi:hypothetical protein